MPHEPLASRYILGVRVHATSYDDATQRVLAWAHEGASRYLCATSVHGVIEASDADDFKRVLNSADLVTPDGMPLVWALRKLGVDGATRVYGPTLTLRVCEAAAHAGVPIGLYGGTPDSLQAFVEFLESRFPPIQIACRIAPPFRPLTPEEDDAYVQEINASGARILFVGIGCPKQERWMADHKGRVHAAMLGVGAAFDFHAGRVQQAPTWMQQNGLEWLFRVAVEPKRLWKRYSRIVPRFMGQFGWQLVRTRLRPNRTATA